MKLHCARFQAKRMDVVWGETAGVDGQLWLLCPILFTLQVIVLLLLHSQLSHCGYAKAP